MLFLSSFSNGQRNSSSRSPSENLEKHMAYESISPLKLRFGDGAYFSLPCGKRTKRNGSLRKFSLYYLKISIETITSYFDLIYNSASVIVIPLLG